MVIEIECVAALDAEEFAVDAGEIAIVAANDLVVAHAERGLASVRTVSANGSHVLHFPGPGLIAIGAAGQGADRADVDTHAALVALQVILTIGRDLGSNAAVHDSQGADAHALIANAHAAEAEYAAGRVVEDYGRPLLLVDMQLGLFVAALAGAVPEDHVLKLAPAAFTPNRPTQRRIAGPKFIAGS